MGQFPVDDFVLNRNQRIMFDINVNVNRTCPDAGAWEIELPPGQYLITFVYDVHRELLGFGSTNPAFTHIFAGFLPTVGHPSAVAFTSY